MLPQFKKKYVIIHIKRAHQCTGDPSSTEQSQLRHQHAKTEIYVKSLRRCAKPNTTAWAVARHSGKIGTRNKKHFWFLFNSGSHSNLNHWVLPQKQTHSKSASQTSLIRFRLKIIAHAHAVINGSIIKPIVNLSKLNVIVYIRKDCNISSRKIKNK